MLKNLIYKAINTRVGHILIFELLQFIVREASKKPKFQQSTHALNLLYMDFERELSKLKSGEPFESLLLQLNKSKNGEKS
jgi:hypothetical protein